MSSYFGSHSSGGKVRVTNSSDLLTALRIQTIYNANQTNPKSKIRTAMHSNPVETQVQFNAIAQQINYGVKHTQIFQGRPASPPSILAVSSLNHSARITWNSPSNNGGTPITGYILKATPQTPSGPEMTQTSEGTGRVYIFTGLTNGHSYKFSVAAVNLAGVSDYSSYSPTITPVAGQPGAPTDVLVSVVSPTSIKVDWTAPIDDGGSAITKYTVYAYKNNSLFPVQPPPHTGSPVLTYTYAGLETGSTYYFKVAAWTTATGGSPSATTSSPSNNIVPCGATSAPGTPTGDAGNTMVTLNWTAPVDLQGSEIGYYQIHVLNASGTLLRSLDTVTDALTYDVTGLDNGVGYKFKVNSKTTINDFTSAQSSASSVITPDIPIGGTTPTAPQNLVADYVGINPAVGGGVHLSWDAPTTGQPSKYVISSKLTGSSFFYRTMKNVPGNTLECVIKTDDISLDGETPFSIPNGTAFDYVVYAVDVGVETVTGPYSDPVTFTAASVPTWNPRSGNVVVSKALAGQLAISWSGAVANGSPITGYKLYASDTYIVPSEYISLPETPLSYTISSLPIQETFIWIQATNDVGDSAYTDPGISQTPLSSSGTYKPSPPDIIAVGHYINRASGVLGATVTYALTDLASGGTSCTCTATPLNPDYPPVTISPLTSDALGFLGGIVTPLVAGQEYTFTVREILDGVESDDSAPSASLLISDVPAQISAAPTIDSVGDSTVVISWVAPSSDAPITDYEIRVTTVGNTYEFSTGGNTSTTWPVDGLNNGMAYNFSVRALNRLEGEYAFNQEYSPLSEIGVPVVPGNIEVVPDRPSQPPYVLPADGSVTLDWYFEGSTGTSGGTESPIVGYRVFYRKSSSPSYTLFPTPGTSLRSSSVIITELENGAEYDFAYQVLNGNTVENISLLSPSSVATPQSAVAGDLPPGMPTNLRAPFDPDTLPEYGGAWILTWDPPTVGGPILQYVLTFYSTNDDGSLNPLPQGNIIPGTSQPIPSIFAPYGIYSFNVQAIGYAPGLYSDIAYYPAP